MIDPPARGELVSAHLESRRPTPRIWKIRGCKHVCGRAERLFAPAQRPAPRWLAVDRAIKVDAISGQDRGKRADRPGSRLHGLANMGPASAEVRR